MQLKVPPSRRVEVRPNLFDGTVLTGMNKSDRTDRGVTNPWSRGDREDVQFSTGPTGDRMDPAGRKEDAEGPTHQTSVSATKRDKFDNPSLEARIEASNIMRGSPKQNRILTRSEFDALIESVLLRRMQYPQP